MIWYEKRKPTENDVITPLNEVLKHVSTKRKNPLRDNETAVNPFPGTERAKREPCSSQLLSLPLPLLSIYCTFCTLLKTIADKTES